MNKELLSLVNKLRPQMCARLIIIIDKLKLPLISIHSFIRIC